MSFCPTRDIHSIYLDNEMPEIYKAEYENHVNSCEKCKKELEKLKKLNSVFNSDAESLKLDETFMDESFKRLQMKMNYSKTIKASKKESSFSFKQIIPSMAAAAAVCLAILLPVQLASKKTPENAVAATSVYVSPVQSAEEVSFINGGSALLSGNLHQSVLSSNRNNGGITRPVDFDRQQFRERPYRRDFVRDIDVFRPSFSEDNAKSIKITVPDMNNMPMKIEISFPDAVTAGQ